MDQQRTCADGEEQGREGILLRIGNDASTEIGDGLAGPTTNPVDELTGLVEQNACLTLAFFDRRLGCALKLIARIGR
jgi:hypothetical protein